MAVRPVTVAAAAATLALLTGCGQVRPSTPEPPTQDASRRVNQKLLGVGTVLDDGSGPELCLGGVAESLPPQCGGPKLVGWTWAKHDVERRSGTTWGDYALVGTYDEDRFTFEKLVDPDDVRALFPEPDQDDFHSPCPEPPGGWRAPDPRRATSDTQDRAFTMASGLPDYAESWIDDRGDHRQDPAKIVVNVRVTKDVSGAEAAIRNVWGGSLCVSKAQHTNAELLRIQDAVMKSPGSLSAGSGHDRVDLAVTYDDGTLQTRLDEKYGKGLVQVSSALQPAPESLTSG